MEFFHPLPDLWSKNLFYKISRMFTKEFIIDFQNRKWNYPNRKWNYFSHFWASDQKTSFTTFSPYYPRSSKMVFKTGNGIIFPNSGPLIKKRLLQHLFHIYQGVQNWFLKQEMKLSKQERVLFLPFPDLWWKNFFYNIFSTFTEEFKIDFQNRKWNYPNRIYFSRLQASDQNNLFTISSPYLPRSKKWF